MGCTSGSMHGRPVILRWLASWLGTIRSGYDVLRILLAALLLTAAGLKAHELATGPTIGSGLLLSRWVLIAVVEFELFFGLWLLSGLLPRLTSLASLGCFALFACVSLFKALSGEATCGCFGRVEVNPWYTFTLDATLVALLMRWPPSAVTSSTLVPSESRLPRGAIVMFLWLAVGIPAAVAMGRYQAGTISQTGEVFGDSEIVVLEPEKWVGGRFPLFNWIDIGSQLAQGAWVLVLYHVDCPNCQEAIAEWQQVARDPAAPDGVRVAFIEVPQPGAQARRLIISNPACALGRLSDARIWFVSTPAVVLVEDGLVKEVCGEGDIESFVPKASCDFAGNRRQEVKNVPWAAGTPTAVWERALCGEEGASGVRHEWRSKDSVSFSILIGGYFDEREQQSLGTLVVCFSRSRVGRGFGRRG